MWIYNRRVAKTHEIEYVSNLAKVLRVPEAEVESFLANKPFSDPDCWRYLEDIGQIMRALPPAPARVLDLGCGSGWTSEMLARCGYTVVGLDIAPDMIALANRRLDPALPLSFAACDYEAAIPFGTFDAVTIYDALHHAEHEGRVIHNAGKSLRDGGVFISIEPGRGHSEAAATKDVVDKYGTTEKDMPYSRQRPFLEAAGFGVVRQYVRLNQFITEPLTSPETLDQQLAQFKGLLVATLHHGLASLVVAVKGAKPVEPETAAQPPSLPQPASAPPLPGANLMRRIARRLMRSR